MKTKKLTVRLTGRQIRILQQVQFAIRMGRPLYRLEKDLYNEVVDCISNQEALSYVN
jgi:hypothetical protein